MPQSSMSSRLSRNAFAFVLAGGRGSRLKELTDRRAKPAVYFGGKTRIIDFALSNALNSGIRRIGVATQYKAHSLIRHLQRGWNFFRPERNESFDILPASQRVSETQWYEGTADAVYQNIDILEDYGIDHVVVLAGDHVYKMDYEIMLEQHVAQKADVTIGCLEVPRMEAIGFGVMHVDEHDRVVSFLEKPKDPPGIPGKPDMALASMGIYVFDAKFLYDQLRRDAADPNSAHDFGNDIIPYLVQHGKAVAHRFAKSCVKSKAESEDYWRDAGTVDAYFDANMDLTRIIPALDLYDRNWPIWTYAEITPPAKFVHDEEGRRGMAVSSLVSGGCIISGACLARHAPVHRRPRPFLRQARRLRRPARGRDRPPCPAQPRGDRPRGADPAGPGGRRGPRARRAAFRRHRAGAAWSPSRRTIRPRHCGLRRPTGASSARAGMRVWCWRALSLPPATCRRGARSRRGLPRPAGRMRACGRCCSGSGARDDPGPRIRAGASARGAGSRPQGQRQLSPGDRRRCRSRRAVGHSTARPGAGGRPGRRPGRHGDLGRAEATPGRHRRLSGELASLGRQGAWHTWLGFEHILFLVSLLLPVVLRRQGGRWEPVGTLATLGLTALTSRAIEFRSGGLPRAALVIPLLEFSRGVELGQLAIVAPFLPLAFLLRETSIYPQLTVRADFDRDRRRARVWLPERLFDLRLH